MSTATLTRLDEALAKAVGMHAHQAKRIVGAKHNLWVCTIALFTPRAHTVIWGGPGVGKSMLFEGLLGHLPEMIMFKTPAFKGSPPEQFLGPVSIQRMVEHDEYVRNVKGKFPAAEYAFIDELLRAPRAVLPVFQTAMSDNLFDNGNGFEDVPLRAMFGATNSLVESGDDDLGAFWDRFTFKLVQDPVQSQDASIQIAQDFLARRANNLLGREEIPDDLLLGRAEVDLITEASAQIPVERDAHEAWAQLESNMINAGIVPSKRRRNHILAAMQTDALLRGQDRVTVDNLQLARDGLWTDIDEREAVEKHVLAFASQFEKDTAVFVDEYDELHAELLKLQSDYAQVGASGVTSDMTNGALRLLRNHQIQRPRIEAHVADAKGRDTSKLDWILDDMDTARAWISAKLMAGLDVG